MERVGGVFTDGHSILKNGGRDQTKLIDAVERQVKLVAAALTRGGFEDLDVRGALCFPDPDGLPLRQLTIRGIVIDGPKPIAKLARRAGPLSADQVAINSRTSSPPYSPSPDPHRSLGCASSPADRSAYSRHIAGTTTMPAASWSRRPDLPHCMESGSAA